ncbi:helix-turn-helix domain-containing protein [Pengzhenrongella sicca]|uniref:Helix-turn-helix domain-containing protein n=1 Tax=Pengzhenrongella sicca TaxID=2819238 RepID=A0A8A4ZGK5_9MICO|nr:helix-turn-helix domain-containing protein [Pengzhenrongella sicca]
MRARIWRLAAEGVPKARIAERLGISRTTVLKAVQSDSPPRYERAPVKRRSRWLGRRSGPCWPRPRTCPRPCSRSGSGGLGRSRGSGRGFANCDRSSGRSTLPSG